MDECKRIVHALELVKEYNLAHGLGMMALNLLWNCVSLQRWVCVYTRLPICGVLEWIWLGIHAIVP